MGWPPKPQPEHEGASHLDGPPTAADGGEAVPTASLEEPPSNVPPDEALEDHVRALAETSSPSLSTQPRSLDPVDLSVAVAPPPPAPAVPAPPPTAESGREKARAIVLGLALGTVAGLVVVFAASRWLG